MTTRSRTTRLSAVLAALALVVGGCATFDSAPEEASSPTPPETATEATTATTSAEVPGATYARIPELADEVSPSIVSISIQEGRGQGSGVIWSADGLVVTNAHVARAGPPLDVILASGEQRRAEVVGTDPRTDLAVLRIDATDLPAATFAQGLPTVGELAIAIGNPFGLTNTVTAGIVSGLDRDVPAQQGATSLVGLIQTDAPISPGNSGGALVNADGEVIGINVAAIPPTARAVAIGFAIPIPVVRDVVTEIVETGAASHPYLGIRGRQLTPRIAERFGLEVDRGVIVVRAEDGGPAAEAGIRQGDVVVSTAGDEVQDFADLVSALRGADPGDRIEVTVVRDGEERTVEVTLGELPTQAASS